MPNISKKPSKPARSAFLKDNYVDYASIKFPLTEERAAHLGMTYEELVEVWRVILNSSDPKLPITQGREDGSDEQEYVAWAGKTAMRHYARGLNKRREAAMVFLALLWDQDHAHRLLRDPWTNASIYEALESHNPEDMERAFGRK